MRRSGILLHPTSLPGPGPCGDLGESAYRFLDWLASAGCTLWQVLPLNPTGGGFSPYGSPGSFAGAPHLISLDRLVVDGLLRVDELGQRPYSPGKVNIHALETWHRPLLHTACDRLVERDPEAVARFGIERPWASQWALFEAIREHLSVGGWWQFPPELIALEPSAIDAMRDQHHAVVQRHLAAQLLFFRQWSAVRQAATARGIQIVGDLPIFVAGDGCDTWMNRDLFRWREGAWRPDPIAGAPPDDFSELGQCWGNPLYNWPAHEASGFSWWADRFAAMFDQVDILRVDHFRGFCAAWEIPAETQDARSGVWGSTPGEALFEAVRKRCGGVPIIAEDLGVITPDVNALREKLGVPGMKVLQFAFGGDAEHAYLPHNYVGDCWVAYTGTHDTDTARGWYHSAPEAAQHRYRVYAGRDGNDTGWDFIRMAWGSRAQWAVAQMQDVLNLDGHARMNTPGVAEGNWCWRVEDLPMHDAQRLAELTWVYGRRGL